MNLLLLCDEYPPGRHGGIGSAVQTLARELVQAGHQVVVVGFYDWLYGGDDFFDDHGVTVYRYRRRLRLPAWRRDALPTRMAYRLLRLSGIFDWDLRRSMEGYRKFVEQLIERHSIDLIERPDYNEYLVFCKRPLLPPQFRTPTVVRIHGSNAFFLQEAGLPVPPAIQAGEQDLFQHATAVSSVSRYALQRTQDLFQWNAPSTVLHNGIVIQPLATTPPAREKGKVVFLGSLLAKKGVFQLAKAWNGVAAAAPEATLHLFGKGDAQAVLDLIEPQHRNRVYLRGHVPQAVLFDELQTAEIGVFPSFAETFGLAPLEAMAAGAAVIYTTRTSGPELIEPGVNGLLVDPADTDSLTGALLALLQDPTRRAALAAAGEAHVRAHFDSRTIAQEHIRFYQNVLHQSH